MKLIFLDVDGVLNHSTTPEWEEGHFHVLDHACVKQIRRILEQTGAKIVLSSTWRHSALARRTVEDALPPGSIIGATPQGKLSGARKVEILRWLSDIWPLSQGWNGEPITNMVVVDDDRDADLGDGSFFRTYFEQGGLTEEIASHIIKHLNKTGLIILKPDINNDLAAHFES